jgi:hypothetical protein
MYAKNIPNHQSIFLLRLSKCSIGDKIDVRDTENVWCVGEIKSILTVKDDKYIYLHYYGWNSAFNEYIKFDNERLAPLSFYTSRSEIPRYILNGDGNCTTGFIMSSENDMQRITQSLTQMEQELTGYQNAMRSLLNTYQNEEMPSTNTDALINNELRDLVNLLSQTNTLNRREVNQERNVDSQLTPEIGHYSITEEAVHEDAEVDLNSDYEN